MYCDFFYLADLTDLKTAVFFIKLSDSIVYKQQSDVPLDLRGVINMRKGVRSLANNHPKGYNKLSCKAPSN